MLIMVTVKVLFDYEAADDDELSLVEGELITNVKQEEGGWWEGTSPSGKTGMFPDNFVEVVPDAAPAKAPSRAAPPSAPAANNKKYCKCTFDYEAVSQLEHMFTPMSISRLDEWICIHAPQRVC
eukprot:TRINITY_DN11737_c0_g1_i7.p1 TRINITY_DN11737_c0_g1~~TRINITY_DN11737_c0_g1_i7.p1  ORF type:complete len:124 (+),score=14.81 TRINITY_DN11737_c0_g1_i7:141-512(+)